MSSAAAFGSFRWYWKPMRSERPWSRKIISSDWSPSDNSAFVLRYLLSQRATLSGLHPVRVSPSGKVEVTLSKKHAGERWSSLGREEESRLCRQSDLETVFRPWIVSSRREVTHDVDHLVLEPPSKAEVAQIK